MFVKKMVFLLACCFSCRSLFFPSPSGIMTSTKLLLPCSTRLLVMKSERPPEHPVPDTGRTKPTTVYRQIWTTRITVSPEAVQISYKNNSPESLPFLWLQLDQNIYKPDSRGEVTTPVGGGRYANHGFEGGYDISSVAVIYQGREQKIHYFINDTRMQIFLPEALKAHGDSLKINIVYSFGIPERGYGQDGTNGN